VSTPLIDASSPDEAKLALLTTLFGARSDVYATRWENASTGKAGWSPATRGGWSRQRSRQDYLPLTDDVFATHLQGRATIGIHPLLRGYTCTLLACDFDKGTWVLDALAYLDACHANGVPAGVRTLPFGKRRPRLDLLPRRPGSGDRRPVTGCGAAAPGDVGEGRAGSHQLRPVLPIPGLSPQGWVREPDRAAAPRRVRRTRHHRLPRSHDLGSVAGPVGVPLVGRPAVAGCGDGTRAIPPLGRCRTGPQPRGAGASRRASSADGDPGPTRGDVLDRAGRHAARGHRGTQASRVDRQPRVLREAADAVSRHGTRLDSSPPTAKTSNGSTFPRAHRTGHRSPRRSREPDRTRR